MSTITFDTLKFVRRLKEAGVSEKHAEAEAEALASALSEALETQLATKADIAEVKADLLLLKWMLAIVIITTVVPALKTLFS